MRPTAPSICLTILSPDGRTRPGSRIVRDEALRPEILHVFEENWRVYGVRRIWRQMRREGCGLARLARWPC